MCSSVTKVQNIELKYGHTQNWFIAKFSTHVLYKLSIEIWPYTKMVYGIRLHVCTSWNIIKQSTKIWIEIWAYTKFINGKSPNSFYKRTLMPRAYFIKYRNFELVYAIICLWQIYLCTLYESKNGFFAVIISPLVT
jgi:hypothetical protein